MQATALDRITEPLAEHGFDGLARAVATLLNEVMKLERSHALGAGPYPRAEHRNGHANGLKPGALPTRLGALTVAVPRARGVEFYRSSLGEGVRSERASKPAVAEMDARGVSTRKVAAITEQLRGLEVTSRQVSRAAAALDEGLEKWRARPRGAAPYPIRDARYEKVRHGGQVVSWAVPVAIGIDTQGKRSVLGVSASLSEAEAHRRDSLASLRARGRHGVKLVVSDAQAGLKGAPAARLAGVPWQRCRSHLAKDAPAYVPKPSMQPEATASLRAISDAPGRGEAERRLDLAVKKYRARAPERAEWLEANVPGGLTAFAPPPGHRRRLRTSDMLERRHEEVRRRARVAGLFPDEGSAPRLVSAVRMEISEGWGSGRRYLTMGPG